MDTSLLRTDPLILAITAEVRAFMRHYDASHAFDHVERVLGLALAILAAEPPRRPALDARVVALAALLHDVGDRKYLAAGQDGAAVAHGLLRAYSADEALAARVQAICSGVSYTSEMEDPERTRVLMERYPELAVVQDADRIVRVAGCGGRRCGQHAQDVPCADVWDI